MTQLSGKPGVWRLWRLEQTMIYYIGSDKGRPVFVPRGFVTDGPSIPRFLWVILPVWGSWSRAGVLHDYLCCLIAAGRPHVEAPSRTVADRLFYASMLDIGVGRFTRWMLYAGVRIGTLFKVRPSMIDHNDKID